MDTPRQLLRYSLPGGLFVLVVAVNQLALRWAWGPRASIVFSALSENIAAAVAGVFIIGFVIYQLYYFFYRPVVPLSRGRTTTDRGGAILSGLHGLDGDPLARIEAAYDVELNLGISRAPTEEYRKAWHTHNSIVRSLINTVATCGGETIRQDFTNLSDIYHALGACRLVAPLALLSTVVFAVFNQMPAVEEQPFSTAGAALFMSVITVVIFLTCHANRRDTWHTMTKQLQRDLRIWFTRQPSFLHPQITLAPSTP
jgi:hypothetical protein